MGRDEKEPSPSSSIGLQALEPSPSLSIGLQTLEPSPSPSISLQALEPSPSPSIGHQVGIFFQLLLFLWKGEVESFGALFSEIILNSNLEKTCSHNLFG